MNELIADDAERSAEWREDKAAEYNDIRNTHAAAALKDVAEGLRALEGTEAHHELAGLLQQNPEQFGEVVREVFSDIHFTSSADAVISHIRRNLH